MNFFLVHFENGISHSNCVNTKHFIHHLRIVGKQYFEPDPYNQASASSQGEGGTFCHILFLWNQTFDEKRLIFITHPVHMSGYALNKVTRLSELSPVVFSDQFFLL
jgi:hypothetical protein